MNMMVFMWIGFFIKKNVDWLSMYLSFNHAISCYIFIFYIDLF